MILTICETSNVLHAFLIIKTFINIVIFLLPFIIMYRAFSEMLKTVITADKIKENAFSILKSLIAALIVFFIPSTINYVFTNLIGSENIISDVSSCYTEATLEKVNSLKEKEAEELERKREEEKAERERALKEKAEKEKELKANMERNEKIEFNNQRTSANAAAFLNSLEEMSQKVASDKSHDWRYVNGGEPKTFEEGLRTGNTITNCAHLARLGLRAIGALGENQQMYKAYNDKGNYMAYGRGAKETLEQYADIIELNPPKSAAQLESEGNPLQPGDIIGWYNMQHTNIYAGKNDNGQAIWYDAGRNGVDNKPDSNGLYHFSSFGPVVLNHYWSGSKVMYIIRLK